MKKVASLRYGVIFKKAFSQPAIFTAFVQDFLGITLNIDHVETEKSFDPIIGKVDSRYDLLPRIRSIALLLIFNMCVPRIIIIVSYIIIALPCWNKLPMRRTTAPI
jgi:hypothetical protein